LRITALEVLVEVLRAMLKAQDLEGGEDRWDVEGARIKLGLVQRPEEAGGKKKDRKEEQGERRERKPSISAALEDIETVNGEAKGENGNGAVVGSESHLRSASSADPADSPGESGSSGIAGRTASQDNSSILTTFSQKRAREEDFETGVVKFKVREDEERRKDGRRTGAKRQRHFAHHYY